MNLWQRSISKCTTRVGNYLNNRKRKDLIQIEEENEVEIVIVAKSDVCLEHMTFRAEDANGREVPIK